MQNIFSWFSVFILWMWLMCLIQGLVDYEGGDSDEEEEEGGEVSKRPRLS